MPGINKIVANPTAGYEATKKLKKIVQEPFD
jgi:hypothetical protein